MTIRTGLINYLTTISRPSAMLGNWRYYGGSQTDFCFNPKPKLNEQPLFPNIFLAGISNETQLEARKQMIDTAFSSILKKTDIYYIDPQTQEFQQEGFFERIEKIVHAEDPEAKVYLSGGNIRNLFGFLYEEILFTYKYKKIPVDEILNKIASDTFPFRYEKGARLSKMAVLGVGGDMDILIAFSPSFDRKKQVQDLTQNFINRAGKNAEDSLSKRTLLPVAEVHEYEEQIRRSVKQGGSPIEWLCFPITPKSGSCLRTPPNLPDIVTDVLKGKLPFFSVINAENPSGTTAKYIRALIEAPFLEVEASSRAEYERSLKDITHDTQNKVLLEKVSYVFERAIQNGRIPEAINSARQKYGFENYLPEVLPQEDIEHRSTEYDPGDFRKENLLIPIDQFITDHTDKGILYHGTREKKACLSMLRGILIVSSKQQGAAALGRGFYTTQFVPTAKKYAGHSGSMLTFTVTPSPHLRILNLQNLQSHHFSKYQQLISESAGQDFHKYLWDQYRIDIVIPDNSIVLIQNAHSFLLSRSMEQNASFFIKESSQTGEKKLVELLLKTGKLLDADRGDSLENASRGGYKEIVEMLLKSGNISEEQRAKSLDIASNRGRIEIAEVLLNSGNISENQRGTAVVSASSSGYKPIVEMLLKNGNISNQLRGAAVISASGNGYKAIVEMLLKNGNISEDLREKALDIASHRGRSEIVEVLLKSGNISQGQI